MSPFYRSTASSVLSCLLFVKSWTTASTVHRSLRASRACSSRMFAEFLPLRTIFNVSSSIAPGLSNGTIELMASAAFSGCMFISQTMRRKEKPAKSPRSTATSTFNRMCVKPGITDTSAAMAAGSTATTCATPCCKSHWLQPPGDAPRSRTAQSITPLDSIPLIGRTSSIICGHVSAASRILKYDRQAGLGVSSSFLSCGLLPRIIVGCCLASVHPIPYRP
mmetsp:Transcript_48947/g.66710  ORF Transcript_48947/g.66710 Transcript_48947/m.66710 type:complete len:221 (-) Transcript_48947:172-834(-)